MLATERNLIDEFVADALPEYIDTMLWSEHCNGTVPGCERGEDCDTSLQSHGYMEIHLSESAQTAAEECVRDFVTTNWEILSGYNPRKIGYDLWLTRNGHGSGFGDGDYPEPFTGEGHYATNGDYLKAMAKPYGEANAYVGDDGDVYCD